MSNLIVLIPSYNDAKTLKPIIFNCKKKYKILVVNDCSTDETQRILKKNKILHILNKRNIGYEKSIIKGFKYLKKNKFKEKYILTMDADGEHPLNKIEVMHKIIEKKNLDFIIGSRKKLNRSLEHIVSILFLFFFKLKDPLSGFKIYRKSSIFKVLKSIKSDNLLVDIILLFKINKFRVGCFEINNSKKTSRKSALGNSIRLFPKFLKIFLSLFNYVTNRHNYL